MRAFQVLPTAAPRNLNCAPAVGGRAARRLARRAVYSPDGSWPLWNLEAVVWTASRWPSAIVMMKSKVRRSSRRSALFTPRNTSSPARPRLTGREMRRLVLGWLRTPEEQTG
jgi:hypothetical protein